MVIEARSMSIDTVVESERQPRFATPLCLTVAQPCGLIHVIS